MNTKKQLPMLPIIIVIALILAGISGFIGYKIAFTPKPPSQIIEEQPGETIPQVDASVKVNMMKSKTQTNTVVLSLSGMSGKMNSVSYELTFDSNGITQGVTGKDVDVAGKDTFERSIYLGTCSKNDCRPYPGVTKVSLMLLFTDLAGKKSQFTKDYPL